MPIYEKLMGNPFVDAGVCGICEWLEKHPQEITVKDLKQIIEDFVPIAANWEKWGSIFTLNHPLTNPSRKKDERVVHFSGMLLDYIGNIKELNQIGDCMGCGRRNVGPIPLLDKTGVPLTGGKNNNFLPVFSEGAGYCAACSFAIQFLPLALVATGSSGGRFLMLHSKSWELMRVWSTICIKGVNQQYAQQGTGGCFKPDYANSRNGLFYMVREMVIELEDMQAEEVEEENVSMEIYSFTNNNQFPDVEIFYIPSPVFQFLCAAEQNPYKDAWHEIVRIGYGSRKSEKDYKKSRNFVYEYLLEDRSIRGFF